MHFNALTVVGLFVLVASGEVELQIPHGLASELSNPDIAAAATEHFVDALRRVKADIAANAAAQPSAPHNP